VDEEAETEAAEGFMAVEEEMKPRCTAITQATENLPLAFKITCIKWGVYQVGKASVAVFASKSHNFC
jgi:hypothetical protein